MKDILIADEVSMLAQDLAGGSEFYTRAKDHALRLKRSFQTGKQPGETSYFQSLDKMFTMRMGFLYCFTGWPSSGKSEFLTQLAVMQGYFKKRKVALYSPESYPVEEFIDMFIHCYLGKSTDRRFPNVCSEAEYDKAIEWVHEHFFFCDWPETPDADKLILSFEHLKKLGCEIFVVDPFNSIVTEGEERNIAIGLKKNLTAFKRFASQKKVMVWLVEHPKTPNDTKEFDSIPGPRHLFGGTMWWNKVDVLATVHRVNREDKSNREVILKTWKIKKQELNGTPGEGTLYFDIRTKRYYEAIHCLDHPMSNPEEQLFKEKEKLPF
jgi:twinkle protein